MRNLLKSDFYKALKSKALYICAGLCVALGVLMIVGMNAAIGRAGGAAGPGGPGGGQFAGMAENASGLWAVAQTLSMGFVAVFAGVFVALFISSEFHYGTMKNTLSKGADRVKVFLSKFIVAACASLAILALFMLVTFGLGSALWGVGTAEAGGFIGMILTQMLLMVAYAAFFTFISMTIRSMGGSLATNIVSVTLASTLLSALNMLFNITINGTALDFGDYWLGGAVSNLSTIAPTTSAIVTGIIVAVAWGAAAMTGGILHFRKADVK